MAFEAVGAEEPGAPDAGSVVARAQASHGQWDAVSLEGDGLGRALEGESQGLQRRHVFQEVGGDLGRVSRPDVGGDDLAIFPASGTRS